MQRDLIVLRELITVIFEGTSMLPPDLTAALRDHIVKDWSLAPKHVRTLQRLLIDKSAPALVHGPPQTRVFRGMTVTRSWITRFTGRRQAAESGRANVSTSFGRPDRAASWSISKKQAKSYFYLDGRDDAVHVILTARTADNVGSLVACAGGLYKVPGLGAGATRRDQEVIALGPIKLESIEWFSYREWFEAMKNA